jgi:hypothetical protein
VHEALAISLAWKLHNGIINMLSEFRRQIAHITCCDRNTNTVGIIVLITSFTHLCRTAALLLH